MGWQFLLATSIVTFSLTTVLQRLLLKNTKYDPMAYLLIFQVLCVIDIGIYVLSTGQKLYVPLIHPVNLVFVGIIYALAGMSMFWALRFAQASEFTILFTTRTFWIVMGAVVFLGEHFSLTEIIGSLLIFSGVVVVSYKKQKFVIQKGTILALLSAFFFGIGFVNDAFLVKNFFAPFYSFISFLLPTILLFFINIKALKHIKVLLQPKLFIRIFLLSLIYSVASMTILLAYKVGHNAAEINAIYPTTSVVTVLIAFIVLKETNKKWKKLLGVLLAFLGVLIIH